MLRLLNEECMTIISKIDKYLVDTVDRVRPIIVKGVRTETTETGLSARVANRTRTVQGAGGGNQIATDTVVYMLPDADVFEGDELIIDTLQRPISGIIEARNKQGVAHHLEVTLK